MPRNLVIFGCGGQGREIAAIALALRAPTADSPIMLGFIDDGPSLENVDQVKALGLRLLGAANDVLHELPPNTDFVVGVADGAVRQRLAARAERRGLTPLSLTHPDSTVSANCRLGEGTVLWAGARLSTNVRLGRHVHVNQNVTIGHDTVAEDFSTINPSAAVSGSVTLGRRCLVGAGAVVLQGRSIGEDSIVGASACVTQSVKPGSTVKGIPAR